MQAIDPKCTANSKFEDNTKGFKKLMTSHTGYLEFLWKKLSPSWFNTSKSTLSTMYYTAELTHHRLLLLSRTVAFSGKRKKKEKTKSPN